MGQQTSAAAGDDEGSKRAGDGLTEGRRTDVRRTKVEPFLEWCEGAAATVWARRKRFESEVSEKKVASLDTKIKAITSEEVARTRWQSLLQQESRRIIQLNIRIMDKEERLSM